MAKSVERDLIKHVVELVNAVNHEKLGHALVLFALLHPTERTHRAVLLYASAVVGVGTIGGSTWRILQPDPTPYVLALLVVGSVFLAFAAVAANGKPPSFEDFNKLFAGAADALGQVAVAKATRPAIEQTEPSART